MARIQLDSQRRKKFFQLSDHPFRLLRQVEWLFLGMSIVAELPWSSIPFLDTFAQEAGRDIHGLPFPSLFVLLCVAALGLMGMRLPTSSIAEKVLYITISLGLV